MLRGHESDVYLVCFSPAGARIYSASWDGTVRAWDARTAEVIATVSGVDPKGLLPSPDGRILAAAPASKNLPEEAAARHERIASE